MISVLAHPGYSATNLQSTGPTGLMKAVLAVEQPPPRPGRRRRRPAAALRGDRPGVEGGQFFGPDGFQQAAAAPTEVQPVGRARDEETARRLWEVSEQLTGVRYLD